MVHLVLNSLREIGARLTVAAILVITASSMALLQAAPRTAEAQTPPPVAAAPDAPRVNEGTPADITAVRAVPGAQGRGVPAPQGAAPGARRNKITARLLDLSRAERGIGVPSAASAAAAAASAQSRGDLTFVGQRVRVEIETAALDTADVRASIAALGGTSEAEYEGTVLALVPPAALEALSERAGVDFVREPFPMVAHAVTGEGAALVDVGGAWAAAGYTGTGVKVAVIDLGFAGLAARQAAGDLPAGVTTVDFCSGNFSTATSHGTGVAEIVHEVAPNAQLYLICIGSAVQLGQAKDYVIANGIRVVNHSVGWFNSSRGDGTGGAGTPDAIVASAQAAGVLWVNSAGNAGQTHWAGTFNDPTNPPSGTQIHHYNTSPVDVGNTFTLGGSTQVCVAMKWDAWPTTTIDYDFQIRRSADGTIVDGSANDQAAGAMAPVELKCYTNSSTSAANHYISITRKSTSGAGTPRIDLWVYTGVGSIEYAVVAGSMTEPATSPNAYAVGAVCWNPTSGGGLQPYSSQGPTIDGRVSPDIAGYDAVSSGTYGNHVNCSSGFIGTSAASPHVAGAAAILFGVSGATSASVRAFLDARAAAGTDYGAAGKDNAYGNGRLRLGTPGPVNSVVPSVSGIQRVGFTLTANPGTWDGSPSYAYQWQRCDSAGANCSSLGGATASTYQLVTGDAGSTVRVAVTATTASGSTSAQSAATAVLFNTIASLQNSAFATNTSAWSAVGGASISRITSPVFSNPGALQVTTAANQAGSGTRAQAVPNTLNVTPGTAYYFSFYARLFVDGTRSMAVEMQWYDAGMNLIGASPWTFALNSTAYSLQQAWGIAPLGAAYAAVDIVTASAQNAFIFYVDSAQWDVAPLPPIKGVRNGTFEVDAQYWTVTNGSGQRTTSTAASGNGSFELTATNGSFEATSIGSVNYDTAVVTGTVYLLTARGRLLAAGSKDIRLSIVWLNASNVNLGTSSETITLTTTDWSQGWKIRVSAPNGSAKARVLVSLPSAQGIFTFFIDEVVFEEDRNSGGNYVQNHGFEVDTAHWQAQSGATIARSQHTSYTGSASLRVDTANQAASGARLHLAPGDRMPVHPGSQYRAHAELRLEQTGTKPINLNVNWFDAGGSFISNNSETWNLTWSPFFTTIQVNATAPGNAAFASIDINTDGAQGVFTFYIDQVGFFVTALNATTLVNGGFEWNANFWQSQNGATEARSTSTARTGSGSLRIDATDVNASGARVQLDPGARIAVTAGQAYEASVYARLAVAGSKNLIININWFDNGPSGGNFISNSVTMVTLNTTDWSQRLSLAATAPSGAARAAFDINTAGAQGAFTFYLDDATWGAPSTPITTVANAGFETNTNYWQAQGNATVTRDTAQARSGSASLKVDAADENASGARAHLAPGARIAVSAGTAYTVSVYGKLASVGSHMLILNINWFNNAGGFVSNSITSVPLNSTSWTALSLSATAPEGATHAAFDINTAGAQGVFTFYLDDANWEEGGGGGGSPITSIVNAGFETNTDHWQAQGNASITRDSDQARTGGASLRVDAADENASGARAHLAPGGRIAVSASTPYTFSVYGKLASAASHPLILNINWFNSSGGFVSNSITSVPLNSTSWTLLSLTATAPGGASFAAIDVNTAGAQGTFTFYLDDASWAEASASNNTGVANGGFETSIDGWAAQNGASLERVSTTFRGGGHSLRVTTADTNASGVRVQLAPTERIQVAAGTSYTVSAYGRLALSDAKTFIININWFDSSHGFISNAITPVVLNSTDWSQQLSFTATAPSGAAWAAFDINTAGAQGSFVFYLDDAQWAEASTSTPTGVTNAGFESNTNGWAAQSGATLTRDTSVFRSGSASLRVDAVNSNASGARVQLPPVERIAVTAGTSYRMSVYARLASAGTYNLILNINWFNASHGFVANSVTMVTLNTTDWSQQLSLTAVAPAGAAYAAFDINTAGAQGDFTFYLDDAAWAEASAPQQITAIANGGFETDTANWEAQNGATLTRVASTARSGSAALRIEAIDSNASGARVHLAPGNRLFVTAGQNYVIAAWARLDTAGSKQILMNVNWFNASNGFISNSHVARQVDSTSWQHIAFHVTAPGGAAYAAIDFNTAGAQGAFTFYLDDVRWGTGGLGILNNSFESNTAHWQPQGGATQGREQVNGNWMLRVDAADANASGARAHLAPGDRIWVGGGGTYSVSVTARLAVAGTKTLILSINWFDASGGFISNVIAPVPVAETGSSLEINGAVAPANAAYASIDVNTAGAQGMFTFYLDGATWSSHQTGRETN